MALKIQAVIEFVDRASDKIKSVSDNLDKNLTSASKKATVAVTAFAAAGLLLGKNLLDSFAAQELVEAKLTQLATTASGASQAQVQALMAQASALQTVGVVGDEVTMSGQAQLATFRLNTESIQQLTPALLDMAASQKGVNVTQEDMMNFANLAGKALEGQVGALRRYGVSLSEAQSELIKTGTEEQKVATLTKVLTQNFGGVNEALGKTGAGAIARAKNAFGDLKEELGRKLMPVVAQAAEAFLDFIERQGGVIAIADKVTKAFNEMKPVIYIIAGALTAAMIPAIWAAVVAVGALIFELAPFIIAGAAVVAAVEGIIYVFQNWGYVMDRIMLGIKTVVEVTVNSVIWALNKLIDAVNWVSGGLVNFGHIAKIELDIVTGNVNNSAVGYQDAFMRMSKSTKETVDVVKEKMPEIPEATGGAMKEAQKSIEDFAKESHKALKDFVSESSAEFGNLHDKIKDVQDKISSLTGDFSAQEAEDRANLAEAIVGNEKQITDLKKQEEEARAELRDQTDADEKLKAQEALNIIQLQLEQEIQARKNNADLIKRFDNEVTEVKRMNSLTSLERAIETFAKEREEAQATFNLKMAQITEELSAIGLQKEDIVKIITEKNKELAEKYQDDTVKFKLELNNQLAAARQITSEMVGLFSAVSAARERAGLPSAQMPTTGGFGVRPTRARAKGGAVGAGQMYVVGENGAETFVPNIGGRIIPNDSRSNVTVNFSGVFGKDAAEEIGDMVVSRLKLHYAI